MYADNITGSMQRAIDETNRRRKKQVTYNTDHGIEPQSILKEVRDIVERAEAEPRPAVMAESGTAYQAGTEAPTVSPDKLAGAIKELEGQMKTAAANLEFEKAAMLRDQMQALQAQLDDLDERPEWERVRQ